MNSNAALIIVATALLIVLVGLIRVDSSLGCIIRQLTVMFQVPPFSESLHNQVLCSYSSVKCVKFLVDPEFVSPLESCNACNLLAAFAKTSVTGSAVHNVSLYML